MKWKEKISVETKRRYIYIVMAIALLAGIGSWGIYNGKIAFGASLIGASVGVGIARYMKEKQVEKLKAKGQDPHDERIRYIAGLASTFTLNATIFLIAIIVLVGSVWGPVIMVNPYDLLGFCLAIIVLIYAVAFYYYKRLN